MSRWFTFAAGFGLDAEIVREVERRRTAGARATPTLYLRTGVRQFLATERRHPSLTVEARGVDPIERVFMAIVTNTTPWTYFGSRPLEPTPDASFEAGLDFFGLHRLGTIGTANKLRQLFAGNPPRGRQVTCLHDQPEVTVRSSHPIAVEVDGDYLGQFAVVHLQSVPEAVAVIA